MAKPIDITGQRFGRLTAVEIAPSYGYHKASHTSWLCVCDCGEQAVVEGHNLRLGMTKSCGCLRKETGRKNLLKTRSMIKHAEVD